MEHCIDLKEHEGCVVGARYYQELVPKMARRKGVTECQAIHNPSHGECVLPKGHTSPHMIIGGATGMLYRAWVTVIPPNPEEWS